jgi:hypothetical protein
MLSNVLQQLYVVPSPKSGSSFDLSGQQMKTCQGLKAMLQFKLSFIKL